MKHALITLTALALLASCLEGQEEILQNLPADSLAYFQVNSPDTLITDLDKMTAQLGLQTIMQGKNIRTLLDEALSSSDPVIRLEEFNLSIPGGLALLPRNDGRFNPFPRMYFPAVNSQDLLETFAETGSEELRSLAITTDNYLILSMVPLPEGTKMVDASQLPPMDQGTANFFLNINNFIAAAGATWDQILDTDNIFRNRPSLGLQYGISTEAQIEWYETAANTVIQGFKDLQLFYGGLTATPERVGFDFGLKFMDDSSTIALLKKLESDKDARSMLPYLSRDASLNFATAVNSQGIKEFSEYLIESLALFEEVAFLMEFLKKLDQGIEAQGDTSALSLDVNLSPEMAERLFMADENDTLFVLQELNLRLYTVTELADEDLYIQSLESLFSQGIVTDFISKSFRFLLESSGRSFQIPQYELQFDLQDNPLNLPIYNKALRISFAFLEEEQDPEVQEVNSWIDKVLNLFPMHFGVRDGLAVFTLGDSSRIKEILVDEELEGGSLADWEGLEALLGDAPEKLAAIGNLSSSLISEVVALRSQGTVSLPVTQGRYPGFVSYHSFGEDSLKTGVNIQFEELALLLRPVLPWMLF
jgi:hypothetical protein